MQNQPPHLKIRDILILLPFHLKVLSAGWLEQEQVQQDGDQRGQAPPRPAQDAAQVPQGGHRAAAAVCPGAEEIFLYAQIFFT